MLPKPCIKNIKNQKNFAYVIQMRYICTLIYNEYEYNIGKKTDILSSK